MEKKVLMRKTHAIKMEGMGDVSLEGYEALIIDEDGVKHLVGSWARLDNPDAMQRIIENALKADISINDIRTSLKAVKYGSASELDNLEDSNEK